MQRSKSGGLFPQPVYLELFSLLTDSGQVDSGWNSETAV